MNDSELQDMLKAARTPDHDQAYWDASAEQVMRNLGRRRLEHATPDGWLGPIAWGSAVALACVAIGFGIGQGDRGAVARLLQPEQQLRREWAVVPQRLGVVMQDEHGLHQLVADSY